MNNDERYYIGESKPGIGGEPHVSQEVPLGRTEISFAKPSNASTWLAFDRKVLSFNAYYKEGVHEHRDETHRTIVRRHRIPKPAPHDGEFYTEEDLNIGVEINIYSKVFKIVNCDHFTYKFLYQSGVKIPDPCPIPEDPHTEYRKNVEENLLPNRPYKKIDSLKQFLDHDSHVLRFYCKWDDTAHANGMVHKLIMYYFLADDRVEIREQFDPNSGHDMSRVLLGKTKLPKGEKYVHFPGKICDRTLLNVFGNTPKDLRFLYDGLQTGEVKLPFYGPGDFRIGDTISVYGRPIKICDCDEFTKNFYRTKYGIVDFEPVKEEVVHEQPIERTCPPYNGYGDEEETLRNWNKILIKPKPKPILQFLKFDKEGLESHVFRFLGVMKSKDPLEDGEVFIISFFLSDDSIQIAWKDTTGRPHSNLLLRRRLKLPGQPRFNIELTKYYEPKHFYIGAELNLNNSIYLITEADEYTLRYMENHPAQFPQADIQVVLAKLHSQVLVGAEQLTKQILFRDANTTDYIMFKDLIDILQVHAPGLTEHELITLGRHYRYEKPALDSCPEAIVMLTQEQLRKSGFDNMKQIHLACKEQDEKKCGWILATKVRQIILSHGVPLKVEMLNELIERWPKDEAGKVEYEDLLKSIDWHERPQPMQISKLVDPSLIKTPSSKVVIDYINYRKLLQDLFPTQNKQCRPSHDGICSAAEDTEFLNEMNGQVAALEGQKIPPLDNSNILPVADLTRLHDVQTKYNNELHDN
ncbi:EF-hand domain-containing family member C2-like [Argonauta hians]